MALAQELLPTFFAGRGLIGEFGLRPFRVYVIRRAWTGTHTGDGTSSDVVTEIVEGGGNPPKVVFVNEEKLALGGLPAGTLDVGPITPEHQGGGTSLALLSGQNVERGEQLLFRVEGPGMGPTGRLYALDSLKTDSPFGWMLRLQPIADEKA